MNVGELWEMVRGRKAWGATVHGVAKSWTQLSNRTMAYTTMKLNKIHETAVYRYK